MTVPVDRPTVSVIVPTYNSAKTLAACLDSVLAQTHPPAEIIVSDDGSSDDTCAIATGYGATVLVADRNRGPAAARNRGAAASRQDVLFFLDSDTALEPDAIANAVRALADGYGCVHGILSARPLFDDGMVERYRVLHGHYWHRRAAGEVRTMFFALAALPRRVFTEIGPLDENLRASEDVEYSTRLAPRHRILMSADVVGHHDEEDRLFPLLRKQFRRSQLLVPGRAVDRGSGGVRANTWTGVLAALLFVVTAPLPLLAWPLAAVPAAMLVLFAVADPGLSGFVRRTKGVPFLLYFTAVHFLVHLAIVAGAVFGALRWLVDPNFGPATPVAAPAEPAVVADQHRHRGRQRVISGMLVVGVLAAVWWASRDQNWHLAATLLRPRAVPYLLLAGAANLAGLGLAMLSWRQLLVAATGPVTYAVSARIYFVGALAQKLPGPVWGVLTHVRLGRSAGVTPTRMVTVYALSLPVSLMTGAAVGAVLAPSVLGGHAILLAVPVLLAVGMFVRPQAVHLAVSRLLLLAGRPLPAGVAPIRAMRLSIATSFACWLVSGLHLWVLAVFLGAPALAALPVCVGGFALAMIAGSIAVFLPDGWGVREVALVVPLTAVLPLPAAGVAVVASRLVTFGTELLGALLALGFAHAVPSTPRRTVRVPERSENNA